MTEPWESCSKAICHRHSKCMRRCVEPGTTNHAIIYMRIPTAMKIQIEAAAMEDNASVNAWMTRCAEHQLRLITRRGGNGK